MDRLHKYYELTSSNMPLQELILFLVRSELNKVLKINSILPQVHKFQLLGLIFISLLVFVKFGCKGPTFLIIERHQLH